jgi:hypothetical protein
VDKGSSLFGTYHRASGVRARGYGQKAAAWAARCATGRVLARDDHGAKAGFSDIEAVRLAYLGLS